MVADDKKIHTINLTDAWLAPYNKRSKKAVCIVQEYVKRHAGAKTAKVATQLNEAIWARGSKNPPRAINVQIIKEKDGVFWAELEGVKFELPKKPEAKAGKKEEKPAAAETATPPAEKTEPPKANATLEDTEKKPFKKTAKNAHKKADEHKGEKKADYKLVLD